MTRRFIEWARCAIGLHVAWPEMNLKDAVGFECRRCHTFRWLHRRRRA